MNKRIRIIRLFTIIIAIIGLGTIGYMYLLKIGIIKALYMTVITISTVGYKEVAKMDSESQLFTIILIFSSLSFLAYAVGELVKIFMEGNLKVFFRRKNMEKKLEKIREHYIICGAGDIGYSAIEQFIKSKEKFLVIDERKEIIDDLLDKDILAIEGDASNDEILRLAKIDVAKGVILALPLDIDNVYTCLTARSINNDVYIVSKVLDKNAEQKLIKAGANKTISPNRIVGSRMASLFIRPNVVTFLDVITKLGNEILDIEEVIIKDGSSICNKILRKAEIPSKTGLNILAIRKNGEDLIQLNPSSDMLLERDDVMIVIGKHEQVEKLKLLAE